MEIKKKIVDGKVAVIVSPGFGAGWSTWNEKYAEFLLFDEGLVCLKELNEDEAVVSRYLESKGLDDVYSGGWSKAKIEWLDVGTRFKVDEYDGSETLHELDKIEFFTA
jgi:hypothetical protein